MLSGKWTGRMIPYEDQVRRSLEPYKECWDKKDRVLVTLFHRANVAGHARTCFLEVPVLDDDHIAWAIQWVHSARVYAPGHWVNISLVTRSKPTHEQRGFFSGSGVGIDVQLSEYWERTPRRRLNWMIKSAGLTD